MSKDSIKLALLKSMFSENKLTLHYLYNNVSEKARNIFHSWLASMMDIFDSRILSKYQMAILDNIYIVKCKKSAKCNALIHDGSGVVCSACIERKKYKNIENSLPKTICESVETCCICISNINKCDRYVTLSCKHMFHPACISRWVTSHTNCPYCRTEISEKRVKYFEKRTSVILR
jgi:hypothetical protein